MRKHHMTYEELLKYRDELKIRINVSGQDEFMTEELKQDVIKSYEELKEITLKLTAKRQANALKVKEDILDTLKSLYLEKVILDIRFNEYQFNNPLTDDFFNNNGADIVSFYISFNVGEPLKEFSKVASDGEMSRVMLAFKVHLLNNLELSTMIFDEIDTGVSGVVAKGMADKLRVISKNTQVLSITHLPIVAAAAKHHLYISKKVENERTFTLIKELNYDERIEELAKMISSNKDDITSQRLAEDMINSYKK
jgi:DNA repair protein RecN (Recombination protein N)